MNTYDAVLVLGGGVREDGTIPSWAKCRFDVASAVPGEPLLIALSAGTAHRPPPRTPNGHLQFESAAGAHYLVANGVSPDRVLIETCSWDTVGNAYYARTVHTDPGQLRKLLIVTSDWHMPRTRFLFEWIYGLTPFSPGYELEFLDAHDPAMPSDVFDQRTRREQASLQSIKRRANGIGTMRDFHRWFFTEHDLYKSSQTGFGASGIDEETLASY